MELIDKKVYIGKRHEKDPSGNYSPTGGIIIDRNNDLMFKIDVLNENYEYSERTVKVYRHEIMKMDFEDDQILGLEERKENFAKWTKDKLFFFQIEVRKNKYKSIYDENENFIAKNITVMRETEEIEKDTKFEIIPIVKSSNNLPNKMAFDALINTGKPIPIDSTVNLGNKNSDLGSFLIFKDSEEESNELGFLYENLDASQVVSNYVRYEKPTPNNSIQVRKIWTSKWISHVYYKVHNYEDVLFIPIHWLKLDSLDTITEETNELSGEISSISNAGVIHENQIEDNILNNDEQNELGLIDNFKKIVQSKKYNLTFDDSDLISFYLSIKTSMLTILAGLSGTGKSKIVTAFADALGILNTDQFKMISIRPSWQDDTDLLGYADTIHNVYRPADSGLVELLKEANEKPNKMYIVVFDEMNLARVEHYFSQFISVLERNYEEREIKLYNKNSGNLFNYESYPDSLKIGPNVRFVGTVNIDESTYGLSDKLLDRANIIELKLVPFTKRIKIQTTGDNEKDKLHKRGNEYQKTLANSIFNSKNENMELDQEELDFFWELNKIFMQNLPAGGFGWRTLNSIEAYVSSVTEDMAFSRSEALDYQIAQRILPKLRGTRDNFEDILEENEGVLSGKLINLFDTNKNISDFENSRLILSKKAKELKVAGFVS